VTEIQKLRVTEIQNSKPYDLEEIKRIEKDIFINTVKIEIGWVIGI